MHIFFVHVPKTGGTSFADTLSRQFPGDVWPPHPTAMELVLAPRDELVKYQVFCLHSPLCLREILPEPLFTATVLRDPVDRAISAYNHILRDSNHEAHGRLLSETASFGDFLAHPILRWQAVEVMTRYFGLELGFPDIVRRVLSGRITAEDAKKEIADRGRTTPTYATFIAARKNLLAMDIVGLSNDLSAAWVEFCHRCGIHSVITPRHLNASDNSGAPRPFVERSPEIVKLMRRESPFDIALYEEMTGQ